MFKWGGWEGNTKGIGSGLFQTGPNRVIRGKNIFAGDQYIWKWVKLLTSRSKQMGRNLHWLGSVVWCLEIAQVGGSGSQVGLREMKEKEREW